MSFATFNLTNNYFSAGNIAGKDFKDGVIAYLSQPQKAAIYYAYKRAFPGQFAIHMNNLFATKPPGTAINVVQHLEQGVTLFWTATIKPQGLIRLATEATLRLNYYTVGAGAGTCPTFEDYVKQPISPTDRQDLPIIKSYMQDYAGFLVQLTASFAPPLNDLTYHSTHKQAVTVRDVAASLNGADDVTEGSDKYNKLIACSNFWQKETLAIAQRANVATWLSTWGGAGASDKLLRMMSDGERVDVLDNHRLAQGPGSYERHKWFYFGDGAPGVGHARVVEFELNGKPIEQLMTMAENVSDSSQKTSAHALLKKVNEKNCIGIHEDLLALFYQHLVKAVTVKK